MESTLASIQTGWLNVTTMRTMSLLGKRDAGAGKAFAIMCALSAAMVGLTNIPILIYNKEIGAFLR